MHRGALAFMSMVACQIGPTRADPDIPGPERVCQQFVEMVVRERYGDQPVLSTAGVQAKYEQCVEFNTALAVGDPQKYDAIVKCAAQQSLPVNWAVCGFQIETQYER